MGVRLGNGTGLREADGLDYYASEKELAALRDEDEKEDWRCVSFEDLNRYQCGFSFLDLEGLRFYLPALMRFDLLHDEFSEGGLAAEASPCFHIDNHFSELFGILNLAQRLAVQHYLEYKLDRVIGAYGGEVEAMGTVFYAEVEGGVLRCWEWNGVD